MIPRIRGRALKLKGLMDEQGHKDIARTEIGQLKNERHILAAMIRDRVNQLSWPEEASEQVLVPVGLLLALVRATNGGKLPFITIHQIDMVNKESPPSLMNRMVDELDENTALSVLLLRALGSLLLEEQDLVATELLARVYCILSMAFDEQLGRN